MDFSASWLRSRAIQDQANASEQIRVNAARCDRCATGHRPAATLALAFASELFEQLDLDLLNFEKPIVLTPQKMIEFFVKVPDFQLGFQVDFVIVFAAQSVARFAPVLAHHDYRRLQ